MKKKILVSLLSVAMTATLATGTVTAFAESAPVAKTATTASTKATTLAEWKEKGEGYDYVIGGEKWTVGGTNMNYYRGYDVNGDLVVENADGVSYYKGGTQKKMLLDGFSAKFKIQTASGELAAGAHVGIGFGGELEQHYPTHGFVFEMQEDGFFDMYLVQAHYIYGGDGAWHQGEGDNVLGRLRDANGNEVSLDIGLNDEITLEIKYLSAEQRTAMGLQHPGFSAYALFVNGNAYYYLSTTDNKFYSVNGSTLPTDNNGNYYGYLTVFGNSCGELIAGLPTPPELTALGADNVSARITFDKISCDGTDSYASLAASEGREGFVSEADHTYGTITKGAHKDKQALVSKENTITYRTANTLKVGAAEYKLAVNSYRLYDATNPQKVTVQVLSSADAGATGVDLVLTRTADKKLTATSSLTGATPLEIDYDFEKSEELTLGIFVGQNATFLSVNGIPVANVSAAIDPAFVEGNGYLSVKAEGFERIISGSMITDGTAQRKTIIKDITTAFSALEVAYNGTVSGYAEKATLLLEDDTTAEVDLVWNLSKVPLDAPGKYVVYGDFAAAAYDEYIITEALVEELQFALTVQYPEGYVKYLSDEFTNGGFDWFDWSNLTQNFIYKKADGVDYFISDGFANTPQFMPINTTKKDVDGFNVDITMKAYGESAYVVFGLMPNTSHINHENPHLSLGFSYDKQQNSTSLIVFSNDAWTGGVAEVATFKNVENPTETVGGINGLAIDWTGEKAFNLSFELGEDEYVYMYITVEGKTWQVCKADGSPKKLAYSVYDQAGKGYFLPWNEGGYNALTIKQNFTRYAVGFEKGETSKIVPFGSAHGLPTTTKITLNDGRVVDGTITYSGTYTPETAGTYSLTATVSYEGEEALGNGTTIWQDVEEISYAVDVIVQEEATTVTAITLPENISVEYGTNPVFPEEVEITVYSAYYDRETTQTVAATFNSDTFNRFVAGEYEFTIVLEGNYVYGDSVVQTVKVTVLPEEGVGDGDSSGGGNGGATEEGCGCGGSIGSGLAIGATMLFGVAVVATRKRKED